MPNFAPLIIAIICYLAASSLILRYVRFADEESRGAGSLNSAFLLTYIAAAAHFVYAYLVGQVAGNLNLSLSSMIVVVSGILVVIYLIGCTLMPIRRLGLLVFPITTLSLIFSVVWNSDATILSNALNNPAFNAHVLISIVAYSLLAIASVQALLYVYQERQIKKRTNPAMLLALPPLQTMELLLFRLVGIGFVLLTLTLLTGAIFSQQIFGHAFAFKHHTILALVGWLVFAIMLFKRVNNGLRGSQAVIWTIAGFAFIQLGYFGTKIVSESLNIAQ